MSSVLIAGLGNIGSPLAGLMARQNVHRLVLVGAIGFEPMTPRS